MLILRSSMIATAIAGSVVTSLFAGCGTDPDRVPVFKTNGHITFQNQPIAGAFVVLHPKGASALDAPRPTAKVNSYGSFETTTFESSDGAPAGEYVVTVQWQQLVSRDGDWVPGPNLLPAKYGSAATSDLVVRIAEGENHLAPIELRR